MKGFSKKEMIFLELKQNDDVLRCIESMLADAQKVSTAQKRSVTNGLMIRNFFVVGVYRTPGVGKKDVHDHISDRANELALPVEREHIHTKFIPESQYSVTLF